MLTAQGSFIVGCSFALAAGGIIAQKESVALLGLTGVFWCVIHWIRFEIAQNRIGKFFASFQKTINGDDSDSITMVTDRRYEICLQGTLKAFPRGFRLTLNDTVPDIMRQTGSSSLVIDTSLRPTLSWSAVHQIAHRYQVESPICGRVEFPGIQVEISDHWGMFRSDRFHAMYQRVTVLPYLIRPQTTVSVLKHNNLQRHLGHHRNSSAGISSELHGIRDYRVGDPPRTIAWKPTARLGKLMTCEYESEVPIRSTILVDLAAYQFDGRPGPTAGDRAISTSASIAKLLLADRDPVAAVLMSEHHAHRLDHGSGERQLAKLLQHLMIYSNPHPPMDHFYLPDLIQVVFENATRRFPQLFDERFNEGRTHFRWLLWSLAPSDRIRRSLSVVLEHLFDLPVGFATRMQFDDAELRKYCLKYVEKFNVVSSATSVAIDPPYFDMGQWLRARNEMTLAICDRMTQVRARAKDNELFVVVAPEPHDFLGAEMLESSVKQCIAAGHRVMFVAPERPVMRGLVEDSVAAEIITKYSSGSNRRAESDLGNRLNRVGATFARIDDPQLMKLVATEIGILQSSTGRARQSRGVRR